MEKKTEEAKESFLDAVESALNTLGTEGSKTDGSKMTMKPKNVIPILFVATHGCYVAKRDPPTSSLNMVTFNTPPDMNIVQLNSCKLSVVNNNSQLDNDIDTVACDVINYMDNPDDTRTVSKLLNDLILQFDTFHRNSNYTEFEQYMIEPFKSNVGKDNMFSYSELPGNSVMYNKFFNIHLEPHLDENLSEAEKETEYKKWYEKSDLRVIENSVYGSRLTFFNPYEENVEIEESGKGPKGEKRGRNIYYDVINYLRFKGKNVSDSGGLYLKDIISFLYEKEKIRDLLIIDMSCSVVYSTTDDRYIDENSDSDAKELEEIEGKNEELRKKVFARGPNPPIEPDRLLLNKGFGGKRTKKHRLAKRRKSKRTTRRRKLRRKTRKNKKNI
jgi:hypothetical protein